MTNNSNNNKIVVIIIIIYRVSGTHPPYSSSPSHHHGFFSSHPETWLQSNVEALAPRVRPRMERWGPWGNGEILHGFGWFSNPTRGWNIEKNGGATSCVFNPLWVENCPWPWFPELKPWGLVNLIPLSLAKWQEIMLNIGFRADFKTENSSLPNPNQDSQWIAPFHQLSSVGISQPLAYIKLASTKVDDIPKLARTFCRIYH